MNELKSYGLVDIQSFIDAPVEKLQQVAAKGSRLDHHLFHEHTFQQQILPVPTGEKLSKGSYGATKSFAILGQLMLLLGNESANRF